MNPLATTGDLLCLWWRVYAERRRMGPVEYQEVRVDLVRMGHCVHGRHPLELLGGVCDALGTGEEDEAWWALLCVWPHGFVPDPAATPVAVHRFDPVPGAELRRS